MVTAEVALALPAVVVVVLAAAAVVGAVAAQVSCADAARAAARAAARGEPHVVVEAAAQAVDGDVVDVDVEQAGDGLVAVTVVARPSSWPARLPVPDVTARATALAETVP